MVSHKILLPEVPRSAPVTRYTNSSVTEQRNIKSEITKLEAQCEQLNLELVNVRLERKQSDLTKALAVELQAVEPKESFNPIQDQLHNLKRPMKLLIFCF